MSELGISADERAYRYLMIGTMAVAIGAFRLMLTMTGSGKRYNDGFMDEMRDKMNTGFTGFQK
jgi:hypothetical protein